MPEKVTVEQINAHLKSGLKRVILFDGVQPGTRIDLVK